jgi:prevent-host-death family protein
MQVNIHEAKTHLSRLLQRVAAGEEITIARSGVPVARLVAIAARRRKKSVPWEWIADKSGSPMTSTLPLPDDLLKQFYGGELPKLEPAPVRPRKSAKKPR